MPIRRHFYHANTYAFVNRNRKEAKDLRILLLLIPAFSKVEQGRWAVKYLYMGDQSESI